MKPFAWTSICISLGLCLTALIISPPGRAKNGDKGGSGSDDTPDMLPMIAVFEEGSVPQFMIRVNDGLGPLTNAELDDEGGWAHMPQTGNFTMQLGGGKGRKVASDDREMLFDFNDALEEGAQFEANPGTLPLDALFIAFNRRYCRAEPDPGDDYGDCPGEEWWNSEADGSQPGLRDMTIADGEVNVSIAMRPRIGPAYYLVCSESYRHSVEDGAAGLEFATANCVTESPAGVCAEWLVEGTDRDGDGKDLECGLWINGSDDASKVGVFNMDFKLHLCLDSDNDGQPDVSGCDTALLP